MAINFEKKLKEYVEHKEMIENQPLTNDELALISVAEEYIDKCIDAHFQPIPSYRILIEAVVPTFQQTVTGISINLDEIRRNVLQTELERRYKEAGWRTQHNDSDYYWSLLTPEKF